LISWKDSFEKLDNELGVAKKKQDALEELHGNSRISQPTYENLNKTLTLEIEQIEARRKELAGKMTSKLNELEKQISTLELFLANVEMSFAASEITEELHAQEVSALNLGLEATKNELNFIKDAIMQLVPEETQAELAAAAETVEATPIDTDIETTPEVSETAPIETPSVIDETSIEQPAETIVETPETPEMPETPIETSTEETTEELTEEVQEETTPEEQIVSETPMETSTEEMLSEEQVTEEIVEAPTEETMSEDPVVTETQTEEIISEEPILSEDSTEKTLSGEQIVAEAPIEETTEEIVSEEIVSEASSEEVIPEEEVVSETLTEESQPFLDEDSE
jgi:hypothetical protein